MKQEISATKNAKKVNHERLILNDACQEIAGEILDRMMSRRASDPPRTGNHLADAARLIVIQIQAVR